MKVDEMMEIDMFFPDQHRHVRFLLGLYISRKRQESGATLNEFAEKLQMPPHRFKRLEAGHMRIKPGIFEKIQRHLVLTVDELNEIRRIACVAYINDLAKALVPNYPR